MMAAGSGFNTSKETAIAANVQDTLGHLAAATAANHTAAANLTSANEKLSSELQNKNVAFCDIAKIFRKSANSTC